MKYILLATLIAAAAAQIPALVERTLPCFVSPVVDVAALSNLTFQFVLAVSSDYSAC